MMSLAELTARSLSFKQWEFLAEHFQGPRPIVHDEMRTRQVLVSKHLIKNEPHRASMPKFTSLTTKGHAVMCAAMGLMADVLVSAGYDGIKNAVPIKPTIERTAYGKLPAPARHSPDGLLSARTEN